MGGQKQGSWTTSADPPCPPAQLPLTADALTFAEVSKDPKGLEWLWSPQIVGLYNRLLQRCELNRHTTEAAAGALQNITAGDRRVRRQAGPGRTGRRGPLSGSRSVRSAPQMAQASAPEDLGSAPDLREAPGGLDWQGLTCRRHRAPSTSLTAPLLLAVGGGAEPAGSGAGAHTEPAAGSSSDC